MKTGRKVTEALQNIYDSVRKVGAGAKMITQVEVKGLADFAPGVWVDFINADLDVSAWELYNQFARSLEDLDGWLIDAGVRRNLPTEQVLMLSNKEFWEAYSPPGGTMGKDALDMRAAMIKAIGATWETPVSALTMYMYCCRYLEHLPIPLFTLLFRIDAEGKQRPASLHIQGLSFARSWLALILASCVSFLADGGVLRECAAPDCDKSFIEWHGRKYHSKRCAEKMRARKYREARGGSQNGND